MDKFYEPEDYLKPYWGKESANIGSTTVCLLGSINLTMFVNEDRTFDYEGYGNTVKTFARMLENVCDVDKSPLPAYQWALENVRQYGMGINGLGSCLMMMGIRYGSEESIEFVHKIHQIKDTETLRTSALLAKERGPFPAFREDYLETPYFKEFCTADEDVKELARKYGVRNAKRLTNPPLGNSSTICNTISNGIEPVFSLEYFRTVIADEWPEGLSQENVREVLQEIEVGGAKAWRGEYAGRTWHYEPHNRGLCFVEPVTDYGYRWVRQRYPEDVEAGTEYIITAQELKVQDHVDVQAQAQQGTDQSISKTVNLPTDYSFEDFKTLYRNAWKQGLVGFTTYRAGTMEEVLSLAKDYLTLLKELDCIGNEVEITPDHVIVQGVRLPETFLNGPTTAFKREGNKYYMNFSYLPNDEKQQYPIALWINCNRYEEQEYVSLNRAFRAVSELLFAKGVNGEIVKQTMQKIVDSSNRGGSPDYGERLGKAISMALRHNIPLVDIVGALTNIEGDYIASALTAVRKYIKTLVPDGTKSGVTCMSCGSDDVIFESGCDKCLSCGASGCQ